MDNKSPTKKEKAKDYIQRYNIETTINEMLNSLASEKSKEPIVFMVIL